MDGWTDSLLSRSSRAAELGTVSTRAERLDAWRVAVNELYSPLPLHVDAECADNWFRWTFQSNVVGNLRTAFGEGGPEFIRSPARLAGNDVNWYAMALQVRGSGWLNQDGRTTEIRPGDLAIYDCTRPFDIRWTEPHRTIVATFERRLLDVKEADVARLSAVSIPGRNGLGALVRSMLTNFTRKAANYENGVGDRVSMIALDLIGTLCDQQLSIRSADASSTRRSLLFRIKNYIHANLDDPELSPDAIACANFISVRYLHGLFRDEELTVARWIRSHRLERCRRDLADPFLAASSIGEIASRHGLTSGPHFSQCFKQEFDMSPSEYRHQAGSSVRS